MIKKFELIAEWRMMLKFWSVRLSLLGSALLSAFFAFPDAVIYTWNLIPVEIKAYLPVEYAKWIPIALIISGVLARIIKQKGLHNNENSTNS